MEEWRAATRGFGTRSGEPQSFFWRAWSTDYVADETFRRPVWEEVCDNAERHYEPGAFTSFIGYEWTPPRRDLRSPNFHRNIIFEGGPEVACQLLPFSIQDSDNVEDLWAYLARYERETGGKVLAIPHNGNLSNGRMFVPEDYDGNPIDTDYARTRERWEPIYEMTQIKGDGWSTLAVAPKLSAIRSTGPATTTRSGIPSLPRSGTTRTSIPRRSRSTTCVCSRFRRRAGPPTMRPSTISMNCRSMRRRQSRNAPTPHPSGTRRCDRVVTRRFLKGRNR